MWLKPGRKRTHSTRLCVCRRRRGDAAELHICAGASVDLLQIQRADFLGTDNMRGQHEDNFVVLHLALLRAEEVFQNRKLTKTRCSTHSKEILLLQETTENVHFALSQPDHLIN